MSSLTSTIQNVIKTVTPMQVAWSVFLIAIIFTMIYQLFRSTDFSKNMGIATLIGALAAGAAFVGVTYYRNRYSTGIQFATMASESM